MDKIYLEEEFDKFFNKIKDGENFAFMRNADGERAIMMGKSVAAQEGNWVLPNYVSKLGQDILKSLDITDPRAYYAISCPCCDREAYYWYSSRIKTKNTTFANMWINKNFRRFKDTFETISRDAVLIANFRAEGKPIGNLNILKHYQINDDCISFWKNEAPKMIANIKKDFGDRENLLFVVSAGPMSGPIIAELFKNNPNNCYVDFGSSIDIYYRGKITRPYMKKGHKYAERNCWMHKPEDICLDVSVVLSTYKRIENLESQLEAIQNQSLKPKEILLFQDGIGGDEKIEIPQSLLEKFDKVKISEINVGCWGRFDFAQNAESKYVCLFDDDTIPGQRWLENCYANMSEKEGLYGTIGIVMKAPQNYPFKDYARIGWSNPSKKRKEVDFVGHSWFFKKEWLEYLFMETEELQQLKTAGEDIAFSTQIQKHLGLKTFVPPHPMNHKSLWGSSNELSRKLGNTGEAISLNKNNLDKMNYAINKLLTNGFETLSKRDEFYVQYVNTCMKLAKILTSLIPAKSIRHELRMRIIEIMLLL